MADNPIVSFVATIAIRGVNPYVFVTSEQAAALHPGWRGPMPVLVLVNGAPDPPWRINLMPAGDGTRYLHLHGDVRRATSSAVGDAVTIELQFDSAYVSGPTEPMPEWFRVPLEANATVLAAWDALPPSRRKEVVRYFGRLKSEAARRRNVERALHVLS